MLLGAAVVIAVVNGIVAGAIPAQSVVGPILTLALAIAAGVVVLLWCKHDGLVAGRPIGAAQRVLSILLGPFALWLYYARTRPSRVALKSIGLSALFVVALMALSILIAFVVAVVRTGIR